MGIGGQLLGVVGKFLAAGLALEALFPAWDSLADEYRILISTAWANVWLNLGKLPVQRQKPHGGLADLLQWPFFKVHRTNSQ